MYKAEFDRLLHNQPSLKNFILFGESSFYIDRYTKILSNIEDANILTLYFDEYDFSQAKTHLSQASLFGGTNLLIIKNDKKIPKKELESLFEASNKGDNRVIFAYYGSDHKSYNNAFKKLGVITVRFFHPKSNEATAILFEEAKRKNLDIDGYTLNYLLNIQNQDIQLAINELEKLSILGHTKITSKEIDSLVYGMGEVEQKTLLDDILRKKDFINKLETFLESGEDEIKVLTSLLNLLNELYMFNTFIRINKVVDAKAILGYNPPKNIVEEKIYLAKKIKPKTFYKALKLLLNAELKMKSSHVDKKAILFSTLIKLQKTL